MIRCPYELLANRRLNGSNSTDPEDLGKRELVFLPTIELILHVGFYEGSFWFDGRRRAFLSLGAAVDHRQSSRQLHIKVRRILTHNLPAPCLPLVVVQLVVVQEVAVVGVVVAAVVVRDGGRLGFTEAALGVWGLTG